MKNLLDGDWFATKTMGYVIIALWLGFIAFVVLAIGGWLAAAFVLYAIWNIGRIAKELFS